MELAGLSCATSVAAEYPINDEGSGGRVLIVCGPGNNGGDGLVAARHLHHFGYTPTVVYPKQTDKPIYKGLVTQLNSLSIPILDALPSDIDTSFDVVLDAIFGFSFKGEVRAPFNTILDALSKAKVPVASVDIPSGWGVDTGPPQSGPALHPSMLISLTAPKGRRPFLPFISHSLTPSVGPTLLLFIAGCRIRVKAVHSQSWMPRYSIISAPREASTESQMLHLER